MKTSIKSKAVLLISTCPHCGEAVEITVTKKQIKAIMKGFKAGSPSQAQLIAEPSLEPY